MKLSFKKQTRQKIKSIRDKREYGELAKEILKGLALGGLIVASFALPNLPQVLKMFDAGNARERFKVKRTLEELKKRKLIDFYEKGDDIVMEITERGEKRVLKYKIDEMSLTRPKKWDGYWRIVMFDIPESRKKGRNTLTGKLKKLELYPLQKSVFVCPFDCRDEIDFVSEFFDVRKFVHFAVAKEIDQRNENFLKGYYNI